jgi:hypothetical protein
MKKRGDIWISAVIYIGLGIALLALILAAGLPVIDRMKDTYTAKQTKEIMLVVDQNIRSVYNQGPGAQTQVKLKISKGDFIIDDVSETISWHVRTKAILSEPNEAVQEGNLQILTNSSAQKGEYDLYLILNYPSEINLSYDGNDLKGTNILAITNKGQGEIKLTKL